METILITGGHKGLGLESVKQIAAKGGYDLLLAGRNLAEMEGVADELRRTYSANVRTILMDVSSINSVRQGAVKCQALIAAGEVSPLGVLMLNAGAQFIQGDNYSADGYEMTFATNCLGAFLLANLLLDDLSENGRIIFTASGTHDPDTMDGRMIGAAAEPDANLLAFQGKKDQSISGGKRYATSKLCVILYTYELDRRLKAGGSKIASIAFEPGFIPETGLIRTAPAIVRWLFTTSPVKWIFKSIGITIGSIAFSGASLAEIAVSPKFATASGKYLQCNNGKLIEQQSSKVSYNEGKARTLWDDSEQLVHLTLQERPKSIHEYPRTVDRGDRITS